MPRSRRHSPTRSTSSTARVAPSFQLLPHPTPRTRSASVSTVTRPMVKGLSVWRQQRTKRFGWGHTVNQVNPRPAYNGSSSYPSSFPWRFLCRPSPPPSQHSMCSPGPHLSAATSRVSWSPRVRPACAAPEARRSQAAALHCCLHLVGIAAWSGTAFVGRTVKGHGEGCCASDNPL